MLVASELIQKWPTPVEMSHKPRLYLSEYLLDHICVTAVIMRFLTQIEISNSEHVHLRVHLTSVWSFTVVDSIMSKFTVKNVH